MKMKKIAYAVAALGISTFAAGSAMAGASAKFAATWTDTPALASVAVITDATVDTVVVDSKTGYTLATIKVPQDKELLVGVSAEIGLVTYGSVKGKNGGSAKAIADAEAYVTVFAVPKAGGDTLTAAPGQIILSKRVQELSATLGGVIQECTDGDTDFDGTADVDPDGTIDIATECVVTDEEIGLLQDTTAAHHFNFVLPNMNQGEYDIKAVFTTGARAEVDICDGVTDNYTCTYDPEGMVSASAMAKAVVNKTMLTVQQVRAAKGGVIDTDITDM
ncbi:MAG: hypothetical protein WBN81_05975 [Gammaproteobacteria bacterium]